MMGKWFVCGWVATGGRSEFFFDTFDYEVEARGAYDEHLKGAERANAMWGTGRGIFLKLKAWQMHREWKRWSR
jgi:hypothetical protein